MNEWERLADAAAVDDPLTPAQQAFVDQFADPLVEEERALYRSLAELGEPDASVPADRLRAEETLAAWRAEAKPRARGKVVAAVGAVAAVAAAVLVFRFTAPSVEVATLSASVHSGTLMLDDVELAEGEAIPVDRWVVAPAGACIEFRGGRSCATKRSRVRVRADRLEVSEGELSFTGSGKVDVRGETFEARDGALTIQLDANAGLVQAVSGVVLAPDSTGTMSPLPGGQAHALAGDWDESIAMVRPEPADSEAEAPPDEPQPVTDADEDAGETTGGRATKRNRGSRTSNSKPGDLLSTARAHVAAGRTKQALGAYNSLRRQHPGSAEAHAASVSIGQLELRRGRASAALKAFSRYLKRGGPLAEEAHWGKIRALHKLGRTKARDAAIASLKAARPSSVYLKRAAEL